MKILDEYPYKFYCNELTSRMTDAKRTTGEWDFVAFAAGAVSEIGPSVRFYGGAPATGITACAPSMRFDVFGNCEVIVGTWMDEGNCPNAFNQMFVNKVAKFAQENLPILCLLYLGKLSSADAMDYFTGKDKWEITLTGIKNIPDNVYLWLQYAQNPLELHIRAFEAGLYETLCPKMTADRFSEQICPVLSSYDTELFEADFWSDEWYLVKYNGNSPCVTVPADCAIVGEEAFAGHAELRQIRLPNSCLGIDKMAFAGCANLLEIQFPEKLDWIAEKAFYECTGLERLVLPPHVWVGKGAFQFCAGLREVEIPEEVVDIEEDAFLGCHQLVIRCKENSRAQEYAQEYGIPFTHYV